MREKKKDNRGASLVLVISVVSLVSILVTVLLTTSLMNVQMKTVNHNAANNFYDAEAALDEIRLGLQTEISKASAAAYTKVLQRYSETSYQDVQRRTLFNLEYRKVLRTSIGGSESATEYDPDYLLTYLTAGQQYNAATGLGARIITSAGAGLTPALDITENGLVLRNVDIEYHGQSNFVSEIKTDILLSYPEMNFTQASSVPELLDYCVVGNSSVETDDKTSSISIEGNLYAGENGLIVNNASVLNIESGNTCITSGSLNLNSGSTFNGAARAALWARDIVLNSNSNFKVLGSTYVADDLELTGSARADLNGEYYGFGNPITAKLSGPYLSNTAEIDNNPSAYSSSIIINGLSRNNIGGENQILKSSLFMTGLTKLVLAGNSYVGNSVMMGESLSVKSNQIAYLVPADCLLTEGETNPSEDSNLQINRERLRDMYGASSDLANNVISIENKGLYYYFIRFDDAAAANTYYNQYYNEATADGRLHIQQRDKYLSFYVNDRELTIRKSNKFEKNLNGNLLLWDETGIYSMDDTLGEAKDLSEDSYYYNREIAWQNMFAAYGINLTEDYGALQDELVTGNLADNVFDNLILTTDRGRGLLDNASLLMSADRSIRFTYNDAGDSTKTYEAIVTNRANLTVDYDMVHPAADRQVHLIISTGDVTVTTDFEGLILADGTVTISPELTRSPSVTLSTAPEELTKLIDYGIYTDGLGNQFQLYDYMVGAGVYLGSISHVDADESRVDYSSLVTYENWSKE